MLLDQFFTLAQPVAKLTQTQTFLMLLALSMPTQLLVSPQLQVLLR
jgi:hypothetical protein